MFLALGVAGLILLTGTDLSIGRMVGMGMTAATIIMHQGINTGGVFGHIFDFTGMPVGAELFLLWLFVSFCVHSLRQRLPDSFTAKFKSLIRLFLLWQCAGNLRYGFLRYQGCIFWCD